MRGDLPWPHGALENAVSRDAGIIDRSSDVFAPFDPIRQIAYGRHRPELALGRAAAGRWHPVEKARR
jgi:hypothetical protein